MCIVHSPLRDATTPYTERWQTLKNKKDDKKITIEFCTIN